MPYRKINQGEHVSRIAKEEGFDSYQKVWQEPDNQSLRDLRRDNPNVLFPDDRLFIPEREQRTESGETEQRHRFRLKASTLKLRVVLRTVDGTPICDTDCVLLLNLERIPLTTDADGMIEREIPKSTEDAKLIVPEMDLEFDLKIGHLDPIDEVSGERGRLSNLGYFAGYSREEETQLRWAVEEFQCEHKLPVTGQYDDATQAKLEEVYGT